MKKIIIVLSVIFYIFTVPVFASEEDILKEPIKEEDIKEDSVEDDQILLKGTENINNTRASVTDPLLAKRIYFRFYNGSTWINSSANVDNINIGEKYYLIVNDNINGGLENYDGAIGYPSIGYFIRGEEQIGDTFNWYYNNSIYNGDIGSMNNNTTVYVNIDSVLYTEPTPEPTTTPEPEEPEVDPETISGNEILREILRKNREINENVQGIYKLLSNNSVSDNVLSDNSVSDNIIYKRLEDYNTSESLALIGLVLAFGALVIYLIHKTVFKIRK